MTGMKVLGAVMAAIIFAGCGEDADMANQRENAGIPGCSHLPSGPIAKSSGTATEGQPMPDHGLQCLGEGPTISMSRATLKGVTAVTIWAS
ncbi:hypothetical protein HMPREF9607_01607 [Cutibacterium modestum HL044PA1]|nr:hypothetical protein HMPREF9607_01607 [Cutibacterium modestum HL044PA1]